MIKIFANISSTAVFNMDDKCSLSSKSAY